MMAILALIHSLQTQIIGLAEKQASTTSIVGFLADEYNKIRVVVTKLQPKAGCPQKAPALSPAHPKPAAQPYSQWYVPPVQQTAVLDGISFEAGEQFGEHTHQTTIKYAQQVQHPPKPQQPPRRKTPALSSVPRIQADDWVEVSGKGKVNTKTFAQAVAGGSPPQQHAPAAPPARAKTYPRGERDLIISTGSQADVTPTLLKLHSIITDELTKCNNRLALPVGMRQSKKGGIVITTAPRAPASSIKVNIESLLLQISALIGSTCRTTSEHQSGVTFLIHAMPTFERGTTKTQEQHEQEYL